MTQTVTVPFQGDTLFAVQRHEDVFVALRPICDRLGLDWSSQHKRTKRDPILAQGMVILTTPSPGGAQDTLCLPLDLLPGWLFGISANQVRPEARDLVLTYQRECHGVLFRHFYARRADATALAPPAVGTEETVSARRQLVAEARQTFGPQAARELWFRLGLAVTPAMLGEPVQGVMPFTYTAVRQDAAPITPAA